MMEIYLLKIKDGALHTLQSFLQSMVIPGGAWVKQLRAGEGKGLFSNELKGSCRQTGVLLEYGSTNTPPPIGLSERVGRTLAVMVR